MIEEELVAIVARELDVSEMLSASPETLRQLKAQRILRAILQRLMKPSEEMIEAAARAYVDAFADWNTELLEASGWRGEFVTWGTIDDRKRAEHKMLLRPAITAMIDAISEQRG